VPILKVALASWLALPKPA